MLNHKRARCARILLTPLSVDWSWTGNAFNTESLFLSSSTIAFAANCVSCTISLYCAVEVKRTGGDPKAVPPSFAQKSEGKIVSAPTVTKDPIVTPPKATQRWPNEVCSPTDIGRNETPSDVCFSVLKYDSMLWERSVMRTNESLDVYQYQRMLFLPHVKLVANTDKLNTYPKIWMIDPCLFPDLGSKERHIPRKCATCLQCSLAGICEKRA